MNNQQLKFKIIPLTKPLYMNYLWIILTKDTEDPYAKNYKTLQKILKIERGLPCS